MLMRQHGPCVLGIPHQNLVNLNGKMTFSWVPETIDTLLSLMREKRRCSLLGWSYD
jgi:hypothetical protein